MIEFSLIKIVVFLIVLVSISLALWVYYNKPKSIINKTFFLYTIFYILWIIFGYLANSITSHNLALFFLKLRFGAVYLCAIATFFFSLFFPIKGKIYPLLNKSILFFGIILVFISVFTDLIIQDVEFKKWGTDIIFGEGFFIFFVGIIILSFIIPIVLYKKYFKLSKKYKLQIQYFLIGVIIFIGLNLIFNILFPIFLKTYKYYQIGDYSAIFLLIFTAYAIVKHKLFDIKIVLTSIFVTLIAILLLLDILFLTPELLPQLYKGLLLVIFIYFGYLLIKSVTEEIKRREEMEILSRKLKKANLKLEKLVEMREEFLHITSHQLRTPLTAIRGMISMWHDGDFKNLPQEEKNEIKNRIYTSAERLNNITNDMINAMELEGKHFDFKFKPVSLEKIIFDAVNTLKINYHAKGLFLNFKKPKKAFPKIQADPEYLSQVFLNIINNAEKYTENGGTAISISQKAKNFIVEITDTGIGISKEGQKLLFRKFSRGQRAKKVNATGSGLGLYIAEQIIKTHHGEIKVKSAGKNKGTTFTVVLPIKQPKE